MLLHNQNRFFLTRQTANIMQDLQRRVKQAGSISLLHAARGGGKSRLLEEFVKNRLPPKTTVFVRFDSNNCFVLSWHENARIRNNTLFSQLLTAIKNNTLLIIDQFDNASTEIQQEILKFWSDQALKKNLALVISIQQKSFQSLAELSKRYHLKIECVELKPLSEGEQLDYLSSNCCEQLRHVAVIPAELKKAYKLTHGLFSQIVAFRSQYHDEISCKKIAVGSRIKRNKILLFSFSGLCILSISAITLQQQMQNTELSMERTPMIKNNTLADSKPHIIKTATLTASPLAIDIKKLEKHSIDTVSNMATDELLIDSDAIELLTLVDGWTNASVSEIAAATIDGAFNDEQNKLTFFDQRLLATKRWLDTSDKKVASIQIMTLSADQNLQQSLNRYLKKLQSERIDLKQIKIFPLTKGNRQLFGVLYGEYKNINSAYQQIKSLPDVLKANQPIPRTIQGINDEVDGN